MGFICSNKRINNEKLVKDLFSFSSRLFTIGRLDKNTTGLLIVTNDGDFTQNIIHPSKNISKEYLIKTKQIITHEHLVSISEGIYIYKKLIRNYGTTYSIIIR